MDIVTNTSEAAGAESIGLFSTTHRKAKINKLPSIKKPKLVFKRDKNSDKNYQTWKVKREWVDTKVYMLPLMPSEQEEKNVFIEKEFRCFYCDELCDNIEYLECKVCPRLFHIVCLFKRGYLNSLKVPLKLEWTCYDCSDLSKILTDEEVRKIINIYDELDFRKNCYVNYKDYMKIKRKLYEEDGEVLTKEKEILERIRFNLIDRDRSGTITWSEFVEFEAADLLSKKNKIELSNFLSIKELIVAKKKFLSFDKTNASMITREEAKCCYLEFMDKLRHKLGPAFGAHLKNCADLFDFNPRPDILSNTAKTMWPEFIRKLTILLLYDRKNFSVFEPKYWKPGIWYSITKSRSYLLEHEKSSYFNLPFLTAPAKTRTNGSAKSKKSTNEFNAEQIMSANMDMSKFRPHKLSEFGSIEFTIRSRHQDQANRELVSSSEIDWGHVESINKLKRSINLTRSKHFNDSSYSSLTGGGINNSNSYNNDSKEQQPPQSLSQDDDKYEYKYDLVTKSIYEKFGIEKQFCDYPQKIPPPKIKQAKGLPDAKRLRAQRMKRVWSSEQLISSLGSSYLDGANVKFLDKIVSLSNNKDN